MSKRILIIDDDKELCEELSEILRDEGFDTAYALNSDQGKELLQRQNYDTLLIDFKMPQKNGVEFLKEIKEKSKGLKIFFVSGSLAIKKLLDEQNLSHLVSGIFNKPFNIEALLEELKR